MQFVTVLLMCYVTYNNVIFALAAILRCAIAAIIINITGNHEL